MNDSSYQFEESHYITTIQSDDSDNDDSRFDRKRRERRDTLDLMGDEYAAF
jgi:hypothetical protein